MSVEISFILHSTQLKFKDITGANKEIVNTYLFKFLFSIFIESCRKKHIFRDDFINITGNGLKCFTVKFSINNVTHLLKDESSTFSSNFWYVNYDKTIIQIITS